MQISLLKSDKYKNEQNIYIYMTENMPQHYTFVYVVH